MSETEMAEVLYEMAMDMDWMDYEDSRGETVKRLATEIENSGESLKWILKRIAQSF